MALTATLLLLAMLAPAPAHASPARGEVFAAAASAPAIILRAGDGPSIVTTARAQPILAPTLDGADDANAPAARASAAQSFIAARAIARRNRATAKPVARGFNARAPPGAARPA